MNLAASYITAQLKKTRRILPKIITVSAISCLSVIALFVLYLKNSAIADSQKNYKIAIVGNMEESYLGYGIQAVKMLDDSKYVVDFVTMTEKEARSAFRRGQVVAIVIIPDAFIDSLVSGRNDVKAKYIISQGAQSISDYLMEIYSDIASTLILNCQTGIFAMQDIMLQQGMHDNYYAATDELNMKYLSLAMDRTALCDVEVIGVSDGLDAETYLICGIIIFTIFLLGITYSPIFASRETGLAKVFQSKGITAPMQILGEYISYFLLVLACVAAVTAVILLSAGIDTGAGSILEGLDLDAASIAGGIIPLLLLFTAIQFWLNEMVSGVVSSVLVQFIVGTAMCYISGCFYPAYFFPDAVRRIGEMLPTGVGMKYLAARLRGESCGGILLGFLFYFAVSAIGSCAMRNYRIRRG